MQQQSFLLVMTLLCGSLLAGCSDSGGSDATITNVVLTQPDPTTTVSGGGVKGPLVNAIAELYRLDVTSPDLKGALVSTGTTNASAALQGVTIVAGATGSFLLELTATADTIDLTTGAAPILSSYQTVITASQIRTGQAYATPLTTLSIALARASAPFTSQETFDTTLALSASQVISTLGFGLDAATDPFNSNPLLTGADTSDEQQAVVLGYRQAIEGLAAILALLTEDIRSADATSTVSVDDVLGAIASDLADGVIDGNSVTGPVAVLSGARNMAAILATDPALLMIPGTMTPINRVGDLLVSETAQTGVTVETAALTSGRVTAIVAPLKTRPDRDGDGVFDSEDAFPTDPLETTDTDGDGTGNNSDDDDDNDGAPDSVDAFPLLASESLDTDGDGTGNNADTDDDNDGVADERDAFPLDGTETSDTDGDGTGDNADIDDDGDGASDAADAFPLIAAEQLDTDGDGIGNNADTDDDGDGVPDADDNLPLDARASVATTGMIGPEGGSIISPDGLMTLTFPESALVEPIEISIGTPTGVATAEFDSAEVPIDGHYILEPDGLQFAQPVTMLWSIPDSSSRPGNIRLVYSLGRDVGEAPNEVVATDPVNGTVSTKIEHFSDLFIVSLNAVVGINQPTASIGDTLIWRYGFEVQNEEFNGFLRTEGVTPQGDGGDVAITRQPELLNGESVITPPQHEEVVNCRYSYDLGDDELVFDCASTDMGTIVATCLDGSEDGLSARMGFNFELEATGTTNITNESRARFFFGDARTLLRVESDGFCRRSVEITEPVFVSIGNEVDRITEAPEDVDIGCSAESQPLNVVASNTRMRIVNSAGSCSRDLDFTGGDNAIFGALILTLDTVSRMVIYGESGLFLVQLINGVFGELNDFTRTTTDVQHRVNDDGSQIDHQAYSVNNGGLIKLLTQQADGTTLIEDVLGVFGLIGKSFIGYAPVTSTTGIGITSAEPSVAYYVDHEADTLVEIGEVGDTALGVSCERLACTSAIGCSLTNETTVGCVVTAFESEELHTIFSSNIGTLNPPTFNQTVALPGIKTASPYLRSNSKGQLVTATVNSNEIGKVRFSVRDPDGTEVQTAEFFLPDFNDTIKFAGVGTSIVMLLPSAEYPQGAVRIGVDNPNGSDDGVLTIPVSEALLEASPEPFFGPAFSD